MDKQTKIDKLLLSAEIIMGFLAAMTLLTSTLTAVYLPIRPFFQVMLIITGTIAFIVGCMCCLRIEQLVGYYKCEKCGHCHVPTFEMVLWAMHFGRTRYMRCPECGKKSWQKKTLTKTEPVQQNTEDVEVHMALGEQKH